MTTPATSSHGTLLLEELLYVIREAITEHPRSKQTRLGPSELGHPCDRWLSHKLRGTPEVNDRLAPWLPTVGTAIHAWLEDVFTADTVPAIAAGHDPRWLLEQRVSVGTIAGQDITGSCDLYDTATATVVDWKGLALDTPLPTPTGWTTMGTVRVGDQVLGSDGQPAIVTAKSSIHMRPCYRLTFSDGAELVSDNVHLWPMLVGAKNTPQVLSTEAAAAKVRQPWAGGQRQLRIRNTRPLDLPAVDLPISPYVLGAWLGDGTSRNGQISKPDDELFEHIEAEGYAVECQPSTPMTRNVVGLARALRLAGLIGHKIIPAAYLRGSLKQRHALLQGLMDTDGSWNRQRNQAIFTSTDKALAYAVAELARSLGWTPRVFELTKHGFGLTITAYDVVFTPYDLNPFRLSRKADLVRLAGTAQSRRRIVRSIEPMDTVPTQCIEVGSADHTYLCGEEMVPTHNTTGKTRLDHYRRHGPDAQYRVQAHSYGRGWQRRGHDVKTVAICFLPRNAELTDTVWWSEPYDEQIAVTALARAEAITMANAALGEQAPAAMGTTDHNCFGGETRYLTPDGSRRFDETAGTTQLVLTQHANPAARRPEAASRADGRWVEAEIRSFGEQPLLRVTLSRNQVTKVIRATPGHWWMARPSNRDSTGPLRTYDTAALRPGMVLPSLVPYSRINMSLPASFGIAHGIVYGDGTRHSNQGTSVSLFGAKNLALLRYFNDSPTTPIKTPNDVEGLTVNHLPRHFKSRPPLDESTAYLYGWLAGYFAADGSVSKVGMPRLASANREDLEFAQTVALRLGIVTYGITTESRLGYGHLPSDLHTLVFARSSLRPEFFLIQEHRERFLANPTTYDRLRWRVESIEDAGEVEEVFCAVVPDTHTFVLDDFVWTFNCGFCPWFQINADDLTNACPGDPARPKPNDSIRSLIA